MKQMIIVVSLLLAFGVGCDEGQDRQLPQDRQLAAEPKSGAQRALILILILTATQVL